MNYPKMNCPKEMCVGTYSQYQNHYCRGEACREAARVYWKQYYHEHHLTEYTHDLKLDEILGVLHGYY